MGLYELCLDMGIYCQNTADLVFSLTSKEIEAYMITLIYTFVNPSLITFELVGQF